MNTKSLLAFMFIALLVITGTYTAFLGLNAGGLSIPPLTESVNQGLDLQGGVYLVYEADTDSTGEELDREMEQVIEIFRLRVDSMGLTEPVIVREGDDRVRVELPGVEEAEDAIAMIGTTARLEFIDPDGNLVISGNDINDARVMMDANNQPYVALELDAGAREAFADTTGRLAQIPETPDNVEDRIIEIILDGEVISAPTAGERVDTGRPTITSPTFTIETASELAALIRAGALPVELEEIRTSTITATLGEYALERSIQAAIIGISLLMLFMIVIYKIPGLVADIALTVYILLVFGVIVLLNATVTLPGIAALILSIGMAVDANVIIFERIKEDIGTGKTVRVAIESGFKRAFRTILDANVTTLIAGVVLYQFGTGPIKGFAILLIIGILCSMFTAVVITRLLLRLVVKINTRKSKTLFGLR